MIFCYLINPAPEYLYYTRDMYHTEYLYYTRAMYHTYAHFMFQKSPFVRDNIKGRQVNFLL